MDRRSGTEGQCRTGLRARSLVLPPYPELLFPPPAQAPGIHSTAAHSIPAASGQTVDLSVLSSPLTEFNICCVCVCLKNKETRARLLGCKDLSPISSPSPAFWRLCAGTRRERRKETKHKPRALRRPLSAEKFR